MNILNTAFSTRAGSNLGREGHLQFLDLIRIQGSRVEAMTRCLPYIADPWLNETGTYAESVGDICFH